MLPVCAGCAIHARRAFACQLALTHLHTAVANNALGNIATRLEVQQMHAPAWWRVPALGISRQAQPGAGAFAHAAHAPEIFSWAAGHGQSMNGQRGGSEPRAPAPCAATAGTSLLPLQALTPPAVLPEAHKTCNLCAGVFPVSTFPFSGDRVKPYCATCTPLVRTHHSCERVAVSEYWFAKLQCVYRQPCMRCKRMRPSNQCIAVHRFLSLCRCAAAFRPA